MNIEYFKVSAVLVAMGNNPTILHPSFLKHENIVPEDWETNKDPICTPPFAAVSFTSGFSFVAELEKLQINFNGDNADQQTEKVTELAQKYANKLPHVRYTNVGINFTAFLPLKEPVKFIVERFIKEGPWNSQNYQLSSTIQSYTYPFDDHQLNVKIEPGRKQVSQDIKKVQNGIVLHANYHAECSKKIDPLKSVISLLQQSKNRMENFKYTAGLFLGEN